MSFTYSGDPSNSNRDAVRFAIGDTDEDDEQLADAEIDYLLTTFSTVSAAAIEACNKLAAKYARKVNQTIGDMSMQYGDLQKHYADLAEKLKRTSLATAGTSGMYVGGISQADKDADLDDSDLVQPAFRRDTMEVDSEPDAISDNDI